MALSTEPYREWDRSEWASAATHAPTPPPAGEGRWNKFQWIGDRGRVGIVDRRRAGDMPEGESSLSGFRHNPGVQHWADHAGA